MYVLFSSQAKNRDVVLLPPCAEKTGKGVMVRTEFKLNINGVMEAISDQGNVDSVAFKTCTGVFTTMYTKQITDGNTLYGTGKPTGCPVTAYTGRESGSEWI